MRCTLAVNLLSTLNNVVKSMDFGSKGSLPSQHILWILNQILFWVTFLAKNTLSLTFGHLIVIWANAVMSIKVFAARN